MTSSRPSTALRSAPFGHAQGKQADAENARSASLRMKSPLRVRFSRFLPFDSAQDDAVFGARFGGQK